MTESSMPTEDRLASLADRLERLVGHLSPDVRDDEGPDTKPVTLGEAHAAYAALTAARDREVAAHARARSALAARLTETEAKLQAAHDELAVLRPGLKSAEAEMRKLLASKRWQAGEFLSLARRKPGRNTIALPVRIWRLLWR